MTICILNEKEIEKEWEREEKESRELFAKYICVKYGLTEAEVRAFKRKFELDF